METQNIDDEAYAKAIYAKAYAWAVDKVPKSIEYHTIGLDYTDIIDILNNEIDKIMKKAKMEINNED